MSATTTTTREDHGTRACYIAGCDCFRCRLANSTYQMERVARARQGLPTSSMVDAEPARIYVRDLISRGMGTHQIARKSGLSRAVINRLLGQAGYTPSRRIQLATAETLLGVRFELADHALVDATRTWQLIRGLVAAGYTEKWIATQLGYASDHLQFGADQVLVKTARKVEQLAERYADKPGPSDRARSRATWSHHGWSVDALWAALDGDPDDDPNNDVDVVKLELVAAGDPADGLTSAERRAAAPILASQGLSTNEIARRLRMSGTTTRRLLDTVESSP